MVSIKNIEASCGPWQSLRAAMAVSFVQQLATVRAWA
jgi:hypothetical protein